MFVVLSEEIDDFTDYSRQPVPRLETAFAQVCCRAGLVYHFEQTEEGWLLVLTDGERPECSPDPVTSTCIKPIDAKRESHDAGG